MRPILKLLLKKFNYKGALAPLLILFSQLASAQFHDHLGVLRTLQGEMEKMIVSAQECVPRKDRLCTGSMFDEDRRTNLYKTDLTACIDGIRKNKYKLLSDKEIGTKYPEFTNSTKRAVTLFDEKLVLFKTKEFNRIDCLHELLHIIQHDPTSTWDLAPATRTHVEKKFLNHLGLAVAEVEKAEKSGDVKGALKMNESLQPYIEFMKQFMALDDWFDEKDIHYFIYIQCEELKCTELDKDIAVTNLFKLIQYFPEEAAALIKKDAALLIAQKEEKARVSVEKSWKPTPFNKTDISKWLSLPWEDLLKMVKAKNITVSRVESNVKFTELKDVIIPENLLLSLPLTPKDKLQNSKVSSGDAFAKFLPQKDSNNIILTPISTKSSLVHEYLHYLQFKHSADYAKALLDGQTMLPLFAAGKITREHYEETTMKNNVLFWTAEYEVYKTLIEFKDQVSPLEHLNNLELFKHYKLKLRKD
jgi:hypothetical protein